MAQVSQTRTAWTPWLRGPFGRGSREGMFIVFSATALYLGLSLFTYYPGDPSWSHSAHVEDIVNRGGVVGAWLADVLLYLFGFLAYLFPIMIAHAGWLALRGHGYRREVRDAVHWTIRGAGCIATLGAGCALATLHYRGNTSLPLDGGGMVGNLLGRNLADAVSPLGATVFLLALLLTGFTLFTGLSWLVVMDATGRVTLAAWRRVMVVVRWGWDLVEGYRARRTRAAELSAHKIRQSRRKAPRIEPPPLKLEPSLRAVRERQEPLFEAPPEEEALPALSLLDEPGESGNALPEAALEAMSRQVELKLSDFGVDAQVVAVLPGPVVTRFELQLAPGLKASKVTGLSKDLARSLSTVSVRVVEIIPGKSVIGLEIPNEQRDLVSLSEVLKSPAYDGAKASLALALGKDISGQPVVVDLARMPHLLVAGTTGAGKSVAINAMILSLLYKTNPGDVRMIMIDPKMLELSVYEGIPHLLAPVVTDMKEAANALRWCVFEMERRYRLMSALGVRNIGGFNLRLKEAQADGEPLCDPLYDAEEEGDGAPELEPLPMIVVIIDELADLMMVTGKKVEELIARLAQKARASGIHLVLATQRPSVDVITGLIKANIPTRIAFQVSSKVDSRTIIDQMGAESLLGHGDMLYMAPGMSTLRRVHGAFVSDQEVHRVVKSLKKNGKPRYIEAILEGGGGEGFTAPAGTGVPGLSSDPESDPLYDEAVRIVTETRRASISGVQRRLKIGYNRAARMLEQMEEAGVVGALQANGGREVHAPPPPEP